MPFIFSADKCRYDLSSSVKSFFFKPGKASQYEERLSASAFGIPPNMVAQMSQLSALSEESTYRGMLRMIEVVQQESEVGLACRCQSVFFVSDICLMSGRLPVL